MVASTGAFVNGMTAAGKTAEKLGATAQMGVAKADALSASLGKTGKAAGEASAGAAALSGAHKLLGAALGYVTVRGFMKWIESAADSIEATSKFAREVGATTEGLSALQYSMRSLGGDDKTLNAGLTALSQTLGDAVTGGSAAADTFSRLGLSAATLASMPTDQAFVKIAGAIAAIPDAGGRAAAAVQIFGESAGALLPLLSQGEAGLAAMADAAKNANQSLTSIEAGSVEAANLAVKDLYQNLDGVAKQIAVSLSPWIISAIEEFGKLGVTGKSVAASIISGFKFVAKGVAIVWDGVRMLGVVMKTIGLGFVVITAGLGSAVQYLLEVAAKLPRKLGGDMFKGAAESVKAFNDSAYQLAQTMKDEILETLGAPSTFQKVDAFFQGLEEGAAKAAKKVSMIQAAGGSVAIANRFAQTFRKGLDVFNEVKTPLQTFVDKIQNLNAMLSTGSVSWVTYARSAATALDTLEKAHSLGEMKLPSGLVRGSSEAVSAINQFSLQQSRQLERPEDRLRRILQQSYEVEQAQLVQQIKIAEAIAQRPRDVKF